MLARRPLNKIFGSGFRLSPKLVWDGDKFVSVPAGEAAYMIDPETGQKLLVAETTTATNIITQSSYFPGNANMTSEEVDGIFPDRPGYLLTNIHASSVSIGVGKTFTFSESYITYYCIIGRGTSDIFSFGIRNQTLGIWVGFAQYNWQTDIVRVAQGSSKFLSRKKLTEDLVILAMTVEPNESRVNDTGAAYIYPGISAVGTNSRVYHMQVERTPYWTSPIITDASAVTRSNDNFLLNNLDKFLGEDSSGTVFVECRYPNIPLDGNSYSMYSESNGTNDYRQLFYPRGDHESMTIYVANGGQGASVVNYVATEGTPEGSGLFKSAGSFSEENLSVSMVSKTATRKNLVGLPDDINSLRLFNSRPFWVAKIWRDKTVRTPEQLKELTS